MSAPDQREDTSWWTRPSFVLSAVLIGLLAIGAIVIATTGPSEKPDQPPAATTGTTAARGPVRTTEDTGCRQPAGSQTVPTTAPTDTTWELVGSMAAPTTPDTYGPGKTQDGFRTCFAHSPTGALYAAVNFWAVATAKPAFEVYERLAADTSTRARAVRDAKSNEGEEGSRLDARTKLQVAGFSVLSYSPSATTVDLAFRAENGGLIHFASPLLWDDGDWKYEITSAGLNSAQLNDLSGYTIWKGA